MMNAKGEKIEDKPATLSTQDRIAIAQCMNLAVEKLVGIQGVMEDEMIKIEARRFFRLKTELENEYLNNGCKF